MKVLITGVGGFEGSNMALSFQKLGYVVEGLELNRESVSTGALIRVPSTVAELLLIGPPRLLRWYSYLSPETGRLVEG